MRVTFDNVIGHLYYDDLLKQIYSSHEPRKRVKETLDEIDKNDLYNNIQESFSNLFNDQRPNSIKVDNLLKKFQNEKPVIVIDLSMPYDQVVKNLTDWNENTQFLILKRIMDGLIDLKEEIGTEILI